MDPIEEYDNLLNGTPIRIKEEDLDELKSLMRELSCLSHISEFWGTTDTAEISSVLINLVRHHNRMTRIQHRLSLLVLKILDYNNK